MYQVYNRRQKFKAGKKMTSVRATTYVLLRVMNEYVSSPTGGGVAKNINQQLGNQLGLSTRVRSSDPTQWKHKEKEETK